MRLLLSALPSIYVMGCIADPAVDPSTGPVADPESATSSVTSAATRDNDGFSVATDDAKHCGKVEFVDYGEGAPGGGRNDDYLVIHDLCPDHHGVKAWAWIQRWDSDVNRYRLWYLEGHYNGNGYEGPAEIWDPFIGLGGVEGEDYLGLKVCLVDGNGDKTPSHCRETTQWIHDG